MSARNASTLRRYLAARRPEWERLAGTERELRKGALTLGDGADLITGYRQLSRDVAGARAGQPGSTLSRQLEALYRRLHRRVHAPLEAPARSLARLFYVEVPAAMRRLLPALRIVAWIFCGAATVGALMVTAFPELAALFASEEMIRGVQEGELWTRGIFNVVPSSVAAAGIAANNIAVTLMAYVLGAFYGLGTLYMIGLNGLMLGALFAFAAQFGMAGELLTFITAHGPAELSIVVVAGAAGLRLGESLARPGNVGRAQAFRAAAGDTGRVFAVCVPFLVVCGVVEGFVSPDETVAPWARATIGIGVAVLLWAALFGRLRLHAAPRAQPHVLADQRPLQPGRGR